MKNKVAIVTGASKGIGAGIAKHFGSLGASVVVNYNSASDGASAVVSAIEKAGGRAVAVKADVTKHDDVVRLFAEAERAFGPKVDVLVNNAGVYSFAPFEQTTVDVLRTHFEVNVVGPFLVMQEALKRMGKGGSIINISSNAPRVAMPTSSSYTASKAALDSISLVLAREIGARGIRVNTIAPGPTQTEGAAVLSAGGDFAKSVLTLIPMGRFGEPKDIAPTAALLASDDASWITGETFYVSGGS